MARRLFYALRKPSGWRNRCKRLNDISDRNSKLATTRFHQIAFLRLNLTCSEYPSLISSAVRAYTVTGKGFTDV